MNTPRVLITAALVATLLCTMASVVAAVPPEISYQVMLTDDSDNPLVEENVEIVFDLYDTASRGRALWTETHNVQTNLIGVVSVTLGAGGTPLPVTQFDNDLWIEITVDGHTLSPRRKLSAAPYALHAVDSNALGGEAADDYLLDVEAAIPGVINTPGNPLEWSKLKGVPSGIADGVDDVGGVGDGHSLDASDGSPSDVVEVNANGVVSVGLGPTANVGDIALRVSGARGEMCSLFDADATAWSHLAILARSDSGSAITANANQDQSTYYAAVDPTAITGIGLDDANGALISANGSGTGAWIQSAGTGRALRATAWGSAYSGYFEDGFGVYVATGDTYPVLDVSNTRTSSFADAGLFSSGSGVNSATWTLYSTCYEGNAGRFFKDTDDDEYAVVVLGDAAASEGLYVRGSIYTTSPLARGVETSRGTEAAFAVSAADVELMASGRGRLSGGAARVEFDRLFAESIAGPSQVTVTVTPVGGWSGVYVKGIDAKGFDLLSEAGDPNVEFHWVAVGRSRQHERRPDVTIPDPGEHARVARQKEAEIAARRPPATDPTERGTISVER